MYWYALQLRLALTLWYARAKWLALRSRYAPGVWLALPFWCYRHGRLARYCGTLLKCGSLQGGGALVLLGSLRLSGAHAARGSLGSFGARETPCSLPRTCSL